MRTNHGNHGSSYSAFFVNCYKIIQVSWIASDGIQLSNDFIAITFEILANIVTNADGIEWDPHLVALWLISVWDTLKH